MAEDTERKRTKKIDTLRQHELLHGLNAQQHLILQALVAEQAAVEQTVELDVRFMPAALEGPATSPAVKTQINRPDWFQHLFGFDEQSPPGNATVAECFELDDCVLTSRVNGASYRVGTFAIPSLLELRNCVNDRALLNLGVNSSVEHIAVRDVFELHSRPQFAGATFMAASQFNCLEFPSPNSAPEDGVTKYIYDGTQGPACALATAPATVLRNYLISAADNQVGQTREYQLNTLNDLLRALEATDLVDVVNGYTNSDDDRLSLLNDKLADQKLAEASQGELRVGLHTQAEVPWEHGKGRFYLAPAGERPLVNQVFCSALAVGYSDGLPQNWMPLARLVLEASYESTLLSALMQQSDGTGSGVVVLTFLGGGVFANHYEWIERAMGRALSKCKHAGLKVFVAHHGRVDRGAVQRIDAHI